MDTRDERDGDDERQRRETMDTKRRAQKVSGVSELNEKWFSRYIREFPAGAVSFAEQFTIVQWEKMSSYLKTKESLDDYASFQYMVKDVFSSLLQSRVLGTEVILGQYALSEQKELQRYYFFVDLQSRDFIKCGSRFDQMLEDDKLDLRSFPQLERHDIESLLSWHITDLEKMRSIHTVFAHKKSLAKCESIKLKNKKIATGDPIADCAVTEAVDEEYRAELLKFTREHEEWRLMLYHKHVEFKRLVNLRALQYQASRIELLPKAKTRMFEKLYQLKDGVKPECLRQVVTGLKDQLAVLKDQLRGKPVGGSAKRWPVLIFGILTVTGYGMVVRRI